MAAEDTTSAKGALLVMVKGHWWTKLSFKLPNELNWETMTHLEDNGDALLQGTNYTDEWTDKQINHIQFDRWLMWLRSV